MAILNYTTSIQPEKTIGEIQKKLSNQGAKSIMIDYDDNGNPSGIQFMILIDNYPINYKLPSNWKGVLRVMTQQKCPRQYLNNNQAIRTSWRIIKDWLIAQFALIESGQAELQEILLPYVMTNNGETLYNRFLQNSQKMLAE